MDLRPDSKLLAINYTVVFGVVAGVVMLSLGNYQRYYYSPEYTSHQGYGAQSCQSCHTSAWKHADQPSCSTANCHAAFSPDFNSPSLKTMQQTEAGKPKPGFGTIVAFHKKLDGAMKCEQCHPSHKLPQRGLLNDTTLYQLVHADPNARMTREEEASKRAKVFHAEAGKVVPGITSCETCHAAPTDITHNAVGKQTCTECHSDFSKWTAKMASSAPMPNLSTINAPTGNIMNQVLPQQNP